MLSETDNRAPTDEEALRVIEEIKALIEFEFNWLRAVKDEEGRITSGALNDYREAYIADGNKKTWMNMIQLLPSSYNQKRTVNMSYETVVKIIKERSNHKLDEWVDFCGELMALPYIKEIIPIMRGSEQNEK